jgi:glycosyltransferase involved in cell wall biosynthesis
MSAADRGSAVTWGTPVSQVSVIVPVLDGESTIEATVRGLLGQAYPPDRFEIIVVDNGSTDGTSAILGKYSSSIRVVREGKKGPAAARNAGIRSAHYPHIAFTDADCVPDASWLRELMSYAARNPWADFVGGPIVAYRPATRIERFSERLWDQERALRAWPPYGITANLLVRTRLLAELGMFDEALLRGQDVDLSYRAYFRRGAQFGYANTAVVRHVNPKNLRQVFAKGLQHGHSAAWIHEKYSREVGQTPWQRCLEGRKYANILRHLGSSLRDAARRQPDLSVRSLFWAVFEFGKQLGLWRETLRRSHPVAQTAFRIQDEVL